MKIEDWGTLDYTTAFERQKQYVCERLENARPDTLIFVEHTPVYTLGSRIGADNHLLWNADRLKAAGIDVVKTNRGGDITYHGPGQLVAYPIVDLRNHRDLHAWLRFLEDVIIAIIAPYALQGTRREGKTGIWLETRKIAAIGVAVRQWVTYHGFALNVAPEITHFGGIIPCGISQDEGTVTALSQELDHPPSMSTVKAEAERIFLEQFAYTFGNTT